MSQTLAAALRRSGQALAEAGIPDAAREARLLLAHALGVSADRITLMAGEALDGAAAARLEALVAARATRRPLAHLTGQRAFWRHSFEVTPDVLDPRPETETLVAAALEAPFTRVLDLGTGSGAILLSLLAERPGATGLGTDRSEAALAVARRNARSLGLDARATFAAGDWLDGITGLFDLVVSNPPYIARAEMAGLAPELAHEPRAALTDEGDGLGAYRAILAGVGPVLAPGGRLLLEIGWQQGPAVAEMAAAAGLTGICLRPDLDGRDRVVEAVAKAP